MNWTFGRTGLLSVAALFILTCCGCVREVTNGSESVFSYELWVPITILVGGILAVPAGWLLRNTSMRLGLGLLIGGPIAAIFFAPSMFFDHTRVTPDGFEVRTGIWGMTAHHDVKFADLTSIVLKAEETTGRRGRKTTSYFMDCVRRDGSNAKIPLGNEICKEAAVVIVGRARELEIPIIDTTGGL